MSGESKGITRRQLLGRTAAVTGGIGTAAAAGTQPPFSPVGRAEALAPVIAAGGALLIVGGSAGAGFALAKYTSGGDDYDADKVISNQSYYAARAVGEGRETYEAEMQAEYLEPENAQATPFGDSAWQTVRATAVRKVSNGATESEAQQAANDALDEQFATAVTNIVERWNTGIKGIIDALYHEHQNGISGFNTDEGRSSIQPFNRPNGGINLESDGTFGSVTPEGTEVDSWSKTYEGNSGDTTFTWGDGKHLVFSHDVDANLPADTSTLGDRDEKLKCYTLPGSTITGDGTYTINQTWFSPLVAGGSGVLGFNSNGEPAGKLVYNHPDLGTAELLDQTLYNDVLARIETAYDEITAELSTFVSNVYQSVSEGLIDPSDVLTASDIFNEFADSNRTTRLAAELMAAGASVPKDAWGYTVEVSHSDIQSDQLRGTLYPQFAEGVEDTTIKANTTVPAADYRVAYLVYQSDAQEAPVEQTLSGESDLEIGQIYDADGNEIESVEFDSPVEYVSDPTTVDEQALKERLEYQSEQMEKLREALDDDCRLLCGGIPGAGGLGLGKLVAGVLLIVGIFAAILGISNSN